MAGIQNILKDKYCVATIIRHDMIVGVTGLIMVQIEPPRANCDPPDEHAKWLLRMAPHRSFDRWSVSAAISERFNGPEEIAAYLSDTAVVYKALFERLSEDYKELDDRCMEMEYSGDR